MSQGEYGSRVGVPRILKILEKFNAPSTFFVPAVIAMLHPNEQRRVIEEGHEIAIHSWIHELNSALSQEDERYLQMKSADKLEEITGVRPVGIRTPSWDFSENTMKITREMGLIYDSSLMADDEPYEIIEDGEKTKLLFEEKPDKFKNVSLLEIGGALGVHTGPGAISVAIQKIDD